MWAEPTGVERYRGRYCCGLLDAFADSPHAHEQRKYCNVFISLSTAINGRSENHKKLIATVSPERLLVESDLYAMSELAPQTVQMLKTVSEIKGWPIEQEWIDDENQIPENEWGAVRRLEANWKAFVKGGHRQEKKVLSKFKRFQKDWVSDDEAE